MKAKHVFLHTKKNGFAEACFQQRGLKPPVANREDFSETELLGM